ncbi:MAG: DUF402 domain-containing protein [Halobacteriales archaeon]
MPRVRVRGIYATAVTEELREVVDVVAPSTAIADRFDAAFGDGPAAVTVDDAPDRLGVGLTGPPDEVEPVRDRLATVARDSLSWPDPAPSGGVFEATVAETLGSGAVVDLGPREGFLPYDAADRHVEADDALRVQVREPAPPWADRRPEVGTGLEASAGPVTLVRGADGPHAAVDDEDGAEELVRSLDVLSTDVPEGWAVRFEPAAADAPLAVLDDALALAAERAAGALAAWDGDDPPLATAWVWFGRESRFALDDTRRRVTTTMPGHHRLKAAGSTASGAVDFVEALVAAGWVDDPGEAGFPFGVAAEQFGPDVGDDLALSHGKPDGRRYRLGVGEVTDREGETVTLRRELGGGGDYDGLGVPRESGDVAVTRLAEGRWWYPTVYRDARGEVKGTYVNVCTPVELFPDAATYVDLEVDVVRHADGTVERLDDAELDAAEAAGHVPPALAEKARAVAASVVSGLAAGD